MPKNDDNLEAVLLGGTETTEPLMVFTVDWFVAAVKDVRVEPWGEPCCGVEKRDQRDGTGVRFVMDRTYESERWEVFNCS